MLNTGQTVFHARHGVGTVKKIEDTAFLGEKATYATIYFEDEDLKLMVKASGDSQEMRPVVDAQTAEQALDYLTEWNGSLAPNWKKRRRANKERLESGEIEQLCQVLKGLAKLSRKRDLTKGDQRQYDRSFNLLTQELSHALKCERGEIETRLESVLDESLDRRHAA